MTKPCPECRANKCGNCNGQSWDTLNDVPTVCPCWITHEKPKATLVCGCPVRRGESIDDRRAHVVEHVFGALVCGGD